MKSRIRHKNQISIGISIPLIILILLGTFFVYDSIFNVPKDKSELETIDVLIEIRAIPTGSREAPIVINFRDKAPEVKKTEFKVDVKIGAFRDKPISDNPPTLEKLIEEAEIKKTQLDIPAIINKPISISFDCAKAFEKYGSGFWVVVVVKIKYKHNSFFETQENLFMNMKQYTFG